MQFMKFSCFFWPEIRIYFKGLSCDNQLNTNTSFHDTKKPFRWSAKKVFILYLLRINLKNKWSRPDHLSVQFLRPRVGHGFDPKVRNFLIFSPDYEVQLKPVASGRVFHC